MQIVGYPKEFYRVARLRVHTTVAPNLSHMY